MSCRFEEGKGEMNYSSGNNSDQSSNNNHYPPLPPTPGQFYPPPPPNNGQSRPYNNAILVGLVVTSVLSIVLISVGGNNAGTSLTLISFVFATAASTTGTDSAAIPVTPTAVVHTKISLPSTAVNRPAPTPTPIPTQKPQKVVISVPTRIPSPTPHAPQPTATPMKSLFVTFTSAYATDYVSGSVSVHTLPGAALTITVSYCSGYNATSKSLQGTSYADGNGDYTWTWEPETKCRGAATASVIASLNGQSVSNADSFTVQ